MVKSKVRFLPVLIALQTPFCGQNVLAWNQQNQKLAADNQGYLTAINKLNVEMALYNNPNYVQGQLNLATTDYNNDMNSYNIDEQKTFPSFQQTKHWLRNWELERESVLRSYYLIIDGAQNGC